MPTSWVRVSVGFALGQPYLDRATSQYRDWWVVRIDARRSPTGLQRYVKVGPSREAALEVAKHLAEVAAGAGNGAPKCGAVLEAWITERRSQLKPSTRDRIDVLIKCQLLPYFDSLAVTELNSAEVWRFVEWCIHEEELSPSTAHQALAWLRRAVHLLWEGELSAFTWEPPGGREGRDPSRRISECQSRCMDLYADKVEHREAFTLDEARIVLDVARQHHPQFYPLLRLAFGTGARGSELRALQWDCVDLKTGVLTLRRNFSGDELGSLKAGRKGYRKAWAPDGCLEMLRAMHEGRRSEFVFVAGHGDWIRARRLIDWMEYTMEKAVKRGVRPELSLHCCRHTYVSQSRGSGLPDAFVKSVVGQTSTIMADYTHLDGVSRPDLAWADFGEPHWKLTGITGENKEEHDECRNPLN
jgi:integrase